MPNINILNFHISKNIMTETNFTLGKFYNKKTKIEIIYIKTFYKLIRKRQIPQFKSNS